VGTIVDVVTLLITVPSPNSVHAVSLYFNILRAVAVLGS